MTNNLPISQGRLLQIQRETEKDESLQTLMAVIQQGWPDDKSALPPVVSPYFNMRDEMSVQDGLIFKGESGNPESCSRRTSQENSQLTPGSQWLPEQSTRVSLLAWHDR